MSIVTACPSCDNRLRIKDKYAGKRVKCPECSGRISVPHAPDEEPVPTERPGRRARSRPAPTRRRTGTGRAPRRGREARKSGTRKTATRRRRRPAPKAEGGGILSGVAVRIGVFVVVVVFALVGNLVNGSATYNSNFSEIHPGMSRAQVISAMGTPDVTDDRPNGVETLGFEAIDRTGRRSSRHTFYFVFLENGFVSDKRKMTEEEFTALTGANF